MKSLGKGIAWAVGLYLALMLGTGFLAKLMLSGSQIQSVVSSLGSGLPVEAKVGEGEFDLAQWFLFRPAITVRDLSIGNPAGFSERPLLEAKALSLQVGLFSLFGDQIDVDQVALGEPELRIERGADGSTNLETLLSDMAKGGRAAGGDSETEGGAGLAIDGFSIDSGTILFLGSSTAEPAMRVHDVDLSVTNFGPDRSAQIALEALLFEGDSSRLDFEGEAGPFEPRAIPARGKLAVELAPADVPESLRREYFGDLLAAPEGSSLITFETEMQGDLLGRLQGEGELAVTDLQLGKDAEHRLPLHGEAPLVLSVDKALTNPSFDLRTENASLELGQGRWNGAAGLQFEGSRFQGGSSGAISGVQIDELLAAFTTTQDVMFGVAEIPQYEIRFAGENADELRDSLNGRGQLRLEEGRIAIFDLLGTIDRHARKMLTGEAPAEGETSFTRFATDIAIADRRMTFSNLALESAAAVVSGQGVVTFDQDLQFDLRALVSGTLAQSLTRLTGGTGQTVEVPVKVRGTVESPSVQPDLGRLVKEQVTEQVVEKAKGLLDSLFNRGQESEPAASESPR